jgi:predicted kinase
MVPLFGESEAGGKRDVLEGRFVWLAIRALRLGVNVILDFGVWGKDERSALRSLAADAGANCELVYLAVDTAEQRRRVGARLSDIPGLTFEMSQGDLHLFGRLFQVPDQNELTSSQIDPPASRMPTWKLWASQRWPSSTS